MSWPEKTSPTTDASEKRTLGKGVFSLCQGCGDTLPAEEMTSNWMVCPRCGHHHRMSDSAWLELICDDGKLERWSADLKPTDPLEFVDGKSYENRITASQSKTGLPDAIEIGKAAIDGRAIAIGSFIFSFMGGSMGSVVGEKVTRLFERATAEALPVVLLQKSGGARMQEGILSLMQMAKSVAALERLRAAAIPFVSVLLHPTTGGVAASFAFLGDVNIAEQDALIGFAGPRVIENTIGQQLPDGFQRAEFLLEHGMVDMVCSRLALKSTISTVLGHLCPVDSADAG